MEQRRHIRIARATAMIAGLALLAGCSSSFGGGSQPTQPNTIVVPAGTNVVCQNGGVPPCN